MQESKNNILDYSLIFLKWRKVIIRNFLIVSIVAVIVSLLMPKWYRASTTILPEEETGIGGLNLSSLMSNLPIGGLGLGMGGSEATNYLAILKSRSVRDEIIKQYNLQEIYDKKDIERTLLALDENVNIFFADEGQIVIEVLDKIPQRAANMANSFVHLLDSVNTKIKIKKARNQRILIEKRFVENKATLAKAENELKAFQEKYGVVDIPEQTKAAIMGAAELQAKVQMAEIELGMLQKNLKPNHIALRNSRSKLNELKKKLKELKNGGDSDSNLFIPFSDVPDVGLQYARLYREVLVQNTLYEFLFQMLEQAKMQEGKDTPAISVLDVARVPIRKAKPKRAIIVILSAMVSLLITLFYVFFVEYLRRLDKSNSQDADKLKSLRGELSQIRLFRKKSNS